MAVRGKTFFAGAFRRVRTGSFLLLLALAGVASYAIHKTNARQGGITGQTQKTTDAGCSCHCSSAQSTTTVTLSTPTTTFYTGTTAAFTVTVSNSSELGAGIDIAAYAGSLTAGSGLYSASGELTHSSPQTFDGNHTATWQFSYTAPSTAGWDTIYATGNAVNLDGFNNNGTCADKWNSANKFVIQVLAVPRRLALGRSSINLGQLRVGRRKADSVLLTSTGTFAITINSNAMKTGTQFSNFAPGSNGRTINPALTEVDSVIFTPTSRGSFSDSLIFTTNSDTLPDQRIGLAVGGQGIQAIFSNILSTLTFGNLKLNKSPAKLTFPFSNSGDDTLFLQTPTISGTGFTINQQPHSLTLPPGVSDSVIVQFAPTARTSYTGTLSFSASNGVTAPSISISGTGVAPLVQFSTPAQIGSARVGLQLQGNVAVKNTGNDTIHFSNATLTQTGTKFTLGSYDATVLPNAQGIFHLTYTPTAEKPDTAQLQFATDDADHPSVTIVVIASGVLPHMVLADIGSVDVGQVKVGGLVTRAFAIYNTGGADLTLTAVTVLPTPPFTVSSQSYVTAGGTGYATVSFSPTYAGTFSGMLIVSSDDAKNPADTLLLSGSGINSALSITPGNVDFGQVAVSNTVFDTVVLSNTGTATVNILGYQLAGYAAFAIVDSSAKQVAPNATAKLILSFTPAGPIPYSGTVTITTDEATPTRTINITGFGIKGSLAVLPDSLDFGPVDTGKSSPMTAHIYNTGSAPTRIASIGVVPATSAFTYTTKPAIPENLVVGDSLELDISFAPRTGGPQSATLTITLADNTTGTLLLKGTGVVKSGGNGVSSSEAIVTSIAIMPNPSNGPAACQIALARPGEFRLLIIDATGRELVAQYLGTLAEGPHTIELATNGLPAGAYFVRILCADAPSMQEQFIIAR